MLDGRPVWKVGELAEATGLTVRTLHHWHDRGLVTPSARTGAGHRLYDESDVRRVYEVVALRELGLSLDAVGEVLGSGGAGLLEILEAHRVQVRTRLAALRSVETTLGTLVAGLRRTHPPTTSELLQLIDEVSTMSETFRTYFTDEQIAELQQRRERLGEDHIARVQAEWPQLAAKVQAEMDAGTDPAEPRVQELATRWMELLEVFDGGDPDLRAANFRMRAENAQEVQRTGGPSTELVEYVARARQVRER